MSSICEQAGVTWGAIQHHFGTKEAILDAVLDAGGDALKHDLEVAHFETKSLENRVDLFLGMFAKAMDTPLYQANITIQRNEPELFESSRAARLEQSVEEVWNTMFGDIKISKRRMKDIREFTFMTLNGIALYVTSFQQQGKRTSMMLRMLRENLLHMLKG